MDENKLCEHKQARLDKVKSLQYWEQPTQVTELQLCHHPKAGSYQHKLGHFKDDTKIWLEQNDDIVLIILLDFFEKKPFAAEELRSDSTYCHYLTNMVRFDVRLDELTRN